MMKITTKDKDMLVLRLPVGKLAANCYILADLPSKKAFVIDPGGDPDEILHVLKENDLTVAMIINTHGHWDHTGANQVMHAATCVPIAIHEADKGFLPEADLNLSSQLDRPTPCGEAEVLLHDGDVLELGRLQISVMHTPGHTPGGVCLRCGEVVFTGDTLFAGSMGRTDLAGGDPVAIDHSLKEILMQLPDELIVLPGHGGATTIGRERQNNPFCR